VFIQFLSTSYKPPACNARMDGSHWRWRSFRC
jgi:hypothetical protein